MVNNKVVVICGGAGLLGRTFSESIIQNRGICVVADSNVEKSEQLIALLQNKYPRANICCYDTDVNSLASIKDLIQCVHAKYGKIDAAVNNVYPRNKNYGRHFFDVDYSDFCENISLNLGGGFLFGQQLAKYFVNQGYGNIINVASIYGIIAPKFEIYEGTTLTTPVEYAVIKSGLLHLTRYMAKYLKNSSIRVNSLSPGGIIDKQPEPFLQKYRDQCLVKGMLEPNDVAGALMFLLSDASKYINGQNIVVDDGFTL